MLVRDWRLGAIRTHELARRYPEKVHVYDERDQPWCAFPGVYVSMPRRHFRSGAQRAWAYSTIPPVRSSILPDLLFSLVASPTARCRAPLFSLRHPDAVVERVEGFTFFDRTSRDFVGRRARYRDVLHRSRFVLCPRGRGTSSIRLYETLAAGRVPVIISDDWVAPDGPDWDSCSIRWPEGRVSGLVEFIAECDPDWQRLGANAAGVYRDYFSKDVSAQRILNACETLLPQGSTLVGGGIGDRAWIAAGLYAQRARIEPKVRRAARRAVEQTKSLTGR